MKTIIGHQLNIILCYMYFDNDLIMALKCIISFLTYYTHFLQCIITDGVTLVIFENRNLFLNKEYEHFINPTLGKKMPDHSSKASSKSNPLLWNSRLSLVCN